LSKPFPLDEEPIVVPTVGRRAKGSLARRSIELRASGAVGLR
jgi:hypothetical protein